MKLDQVVSRLLCSMVVLLLSTLTITCRYGICIGSQAIYFAAGNNAHPASYLLRVYLVIIVLSLILWPSSL
jgi:hypothetical protein